MATYLELRSFFGEGSELLGRIEVGCIVAAEAIRTEDGGTANHANRVLWAQKAFNSPKTVAKQMLMAVLAANKALTVAQISDATDAAIQSNVGAAVDVFADGS